jgi:spermidine synthase
VTSPPERRSEAVAEVLDRVDGRAGELVLQRRGEVLEVVSAGVFLMDTADGRSERLLVRETVAAAEASRLAGGCRLLLGGLGAGLSLLEALADPRVSEVVVAELEPAVVGWHRTGSLREVTRGAVDDPRVRLVVDDVLAVLRRESGGFDAVCLDTDNGPDWLVREENAVLYSPAGVRAASEALRTGGAAGFWSAGRSAGFEAALGKRFMRVTRHDVPVARGEPDVVWVASGAIDRGSAPG